MKGMKIKQLNGSKNVSLIPDIIAEELGRLKRM